MGMASPALCLLILVMAVVNGSLALKVTSADGERASPESMVINSALGSPDVNGL